MKTFCIPALTFVAIAALGVTPGRADTKYTYAGNAFTNFSQSQTTAPLYSCSADNGECGITVVMTFADALPDSMPLQNVVPTSLIILDGTNILVAGLPGVTLFEGVGMPDGVELATDASGNINEWDVTVRKLTQDGAFEDAQFLETINLPGVSGAIQGDSSSLSLVTGTASASNQNDPGVWTTHSAVVPPPPPPVTTPEPGSLALAAPAFLALAGMACKKFRD